MSDEKRESFSETEPHEADEIHLSVSRRHRTAPALYGIMGEFNNPSDLVAAARRTYEAGYRRINGYSPYPIEELSEAIGFTHTSLPLIVLIGGLLGGLGRCDSRPTSRGRPQLGRREHRAGRTTTGRFVV